jgi:hypothetical protein
MAKVIPLNASHAPDRHQGRILDAAESAVHGARLRGDQLRSSRQRPAVNLAAVNYHFGSKEELFQSVLTRRLDPMNQARVALLERYESQASGAARVRAHSRRAVHPALALARDPPRGGSNFLRLLGRAYADPAPFIRSSCRSNTRR